MWPTPNVIGLPFDARFGRWGGDQSRLYSPTQLPNLSAWFDALDTQTMLTGAGTTITDGGQVALWGDKSGNSGVNCLVLNGTTGNGASVPHAANLNVTDLDLRGWIRYADYTPTAGNTIASKWGAGGNSFLFTVNATDGLLRLVWYTGAATIGVNSTVAPTISDYEKRAFRVTLDVDNGASGYTVTFYQSTDFTNWTQVGDAVVGGATTTIATGTEPINIGARNASTADIATGCIYQVQLMASIGGASVLNVDFSTASKKLANGDTFVCATGQTVTLNSSGATGARIAGERDLFQGTLANRPVYLAYAGTKYGYLPGVATSYFSTPDSVAVSVTGDLDVRVHVLLTSVSTTQIFINKSRTVGQYSYEFYVNGGGFLTAVVSLDGTATVAGNSSAHGVSALEAIWFRFTRVSSTGLFSFFKSTDGSNWTAIGTAAGTSGAIFDGTNDLYVGSNGSSFPLTGRIYRAQIYDGIGGTLKADFNPALYTSGTTFTASTGEVWTINGGAHIVTRTGLYFDGSNDHLKTAAFSLSQPESIYGTLAQVSWTGGDIILDGGTADSMAIYQSTAGGSPKYDMYGGVSFKPTNATLTLKTTGVIQPQFNGASSSNRVNRGAAETGNAGTTAGNGLTLGTYGSGSTAQASNIFVSELAIYAAAHSTAVGDRVVQYEGRKHGFSV